MDESSQPPPVDHLVGLISDDEHEDAISCLSQYTEANPDDRKKALRALQRLANDQPTAFAPVLSALIPFLTDEERSICLTTAKLFAAVAVAEPEAIVPVIPSLVSRLTDEDEFYYIRARSAEVLGYAALETPESVASPAVLAELRIGLSFDEPEVKEKLAKALEYIALGTPRQLRHHVSSLADHLDDDNELVRYHLCTALVVTDCEYPATLVDAQTDLSARLSDENAFVRGRACEALGLLARTDVEDTSLPRTELETLTDDEESFVAQRARFATDPLDGRKGRAGMLDEVGTRKAVRETTDEIAQEITSPDSEGVCQQCGLELPEFGPPICPRCGAPH